jgi:hypothetical protein
MKEYFWKVWYDGDPEPAGHNNNYIGCGQSFGVAKSEIIWVIAHRKIDSPTELMLNIKNMQTGRTTRYPIRVGYVLDAWLCAKPETIKAKK